MSRELRIFLDGVLVTWSGLAESAKYCGRASLLLSTSVPQLRNNGPCHRSGVLTLPNRIWQVYHSSAILACVRRREGMSKQRPSAGPPQQTISSHHVDSGSSHEENIPRIKSSSRALRLPHLCPPTLRALEEGLLTLL